MLTVTPHQMKYHLSPNRIRTVCPNRQAKIAELRSVWNLETPGSEARTELIQYYLLKWSGQWFARELARLGSGSIIHRDIPYKVEYLDCSPVLACAADDLMLSFRQVRNEFYTVNYVLVRVV